MFMEYLFFFLIFCILYAYFGYPLVLAIFSRSRGREGSQNDFAGKHLPGVDFLIAAYNEEEVIGEKIENSLALDYPVDRISIAVVSDGSTDRTDGIVRGYGARGVELIRVEGRAGKTVARNRAVARTGREILVFSDANSMFEKDALARLVSHFVNNDVGAVSGNLRLLGEEGNENLYWRYEKTIKRYEDRFHSIIGANGSIYAVRRDLYKPLPPEVDDDFIEPLNAYAEGYRVGLDLDAVSTERDISTGDMESEFRAKKRVVIRGMQSLAHVSGLLNPLQYPAMSFELISHKIFRWAVPFLLVAVLVLNALMPITALYTFLLIGQIAFYAAAVIGILFRLRPFYIPAYFVSTNVAVLVAVFEYLIGRRSTTWEQNRG